MGWFFVFLAAASEMVGVIGLRFYSQQRNWRNGSIYYGGIALSFVFLYASFDHLVVSIAYAVYAGIGTAGAVLLNMLFFGESKSILRIISLAAIIFGVAGLKAIS